METVTDEIPGYKFELGKGVVLKDGTDVTIIAVGMNVQMSLKAAELLAAEGISARVIDMHTIKPLDTELVLKAAQETGCIVTTEEGQRPRRPGRRRVRVPFRYLPGPRRPPRRQRRVWPQRQGAPGAGSLRHHRGEIAEDAKKAISMKK